VETDGIVLSDASPLTRVFLSVPEIRFQVTDLRVVLPYISGSFDVNFWSLRVTGTPCGAFYCVDVGGRFTPGFTGRGGLAFEVASGIHVDLGLRYSFSGKGNSFEQSRWWLAPYVGVLFRHR
jgi:hypothetical protein